MKYLRPAITLTIFFVVVTGILFPLLITVISQAALPRQANGSMIVRNGKEIGSELIGQQFADPKYFHPRPSAAGDGYDANNSSGTNLGPTNPKLLEGEQGFDGVKQLAEKYRAENELQNGEIVPVDAVTRSASGLDPDISPHNAQLQARRIARAWGTTESAVKTIIEAHTERPFIDIFGDARVNVLKLNLALADQLK